MLDGNPARRHERARAAPGPDPCDRSGECELKVPKLQASMTTVKHARATPPGVIGRRTPPSSALPSSGASRSRRLPPCCPWVLEPRPGAHKPLTLVPVLRIPYGMSTAVRHEYDLGAEDVSGARVPVVDIRGTRLRPVVTPVLADPSGVRARRLARAGRAVAFLCLLWLVALGLAGIGILPADDLPLGRAITGAAPEVLGVAPVAAPSRFDLAGRAATNAAARTRSGAHPATPRARHAARPRDSEPSAIDRSPARSTILRAAPGLPGPASGTRSAGTPSATATGPNGATSGPSQAAAAGASASGIHATGRGIATAPGTTIKASTRGHTDPRGRGNSGTAPGQGLPTATTVTPAAGQSGSSPGHMMTPGAGHGNGA